MLTGTADLEGILHGSFKVAVSALLIPPCAECGPIRHAMLIEADILTDGPEGCLVELVRCVE